MQATPATWRMLLNGGWQGSSTLKILCGGEALDSPLAQQLLPRCRELWNLYGPTETTIWSSAICLTASLLAEGFVPIGGPIDNTEFHILDQQQQPVPVGVPGELYIAGAGVADGYLNRPKLTQERFVTSLPDQRILYKTGDLTRRHPNGTLEYLGRLDHQIKLRGFRIELGEIEAVLNCHPNIDQSLVMLRSGHSSESQLVAYCKYCKVWPHVESVDYASTLRSHLSQQLPAYMLPTAYVLLTDFPLTPNGKIDRKALPVPEISTPTTHSSLQTPTEQKLASIWAETLNLSTVNATDHFFEIGGHSLLATRVVARLKSVFGVTVPLRSLFEHPTLSDFAATVDTAVDAKIQCTNTACAPIGSEIKSKIKSEIQSINREDFLPLSYAQQRQWVLAQLEPDNPFYNIAAAIRIEGDFSLSILQETLTSLCQRHEALRTVFISVGGEAHLKILQTVTPSISYVKNLESTDLESVDLESADLENSRFDQLIQERLVAEARTVFDLKIAPLMRVTVIRIDEQTHIISLVLHHIIADAESMGLLMREIIEGYHQIQLKTPVELSPLPVQYVDYAAWQQNIEQNLDISQQLSYWQQQLANVPELLSLPTDYPRPATQQFEGDSYRFQLTIAQTSAIKQLSQRHNATVFMTLIAAFQSLLHRYSGAEDLVVGTPVSNRPRALLEGVLGMFVNTLVFRGDFF